MADNVTLTRDEAQCLFTHLDFYILEEVKNDPDYDNVQYLSSLVSVWQKCKPVWESGIGTGEIQLSQKD